MGGMGERFALQLHRTELALPEVERSHAQPFPLVR